MTRLCTIVVLLYLGLGCGTAHAGTLPRIVGVDPSPPRPGQALDLLVDTEGCLGLVLPDRIDGRLEVVIKAGSVAVRVGYDGVSDPCPTPLDRYRYRLPIGALPEGVFEVSLFGASPSGTAPDYLLDTFSINVANPRQIPAGGPLGGLALAALLLGVAGWRLKRVVG